MKPTLLAAAAALAFALPAGTAIAQDTTVATDAAGNTVVLTSEQQTMYDGWPADRRTSYDAWPETYRTYYWTLSPEQQGGWWALTDEQRGKVYAMTPEQRTQAWASVSSQMQSAIPAPAASADASMSASADMATTTTAGGTQFMRREMTQPVTGSADAAALASGDLPVCKKGQQDGCINGWEKNRRGNKPLSYWPGKPASEMPGKKPDPQ